MNRIKLFISGSLITALAFSIGSSRASAQDPTSGSKTISPPPPAQVKSPQPPTPEAREKKKPKKIWTNDEIGSVKGEVSMVGEQNYSADDRPAIKDSATNGRKNLRQQQIYNYRNQIQQYRGQIDAIDSRIRQLKNFKGENAAPSGGINPTQGYNMVPLEEQVKQLEERKKQAQDKIDDIENDARKNGIEPGELR